MAKNYFADNDIPSLMSFSTNEVVPEKQQGRFGDTVDAFQSGALSGIGGIFDFVGADGIAQSLYGYADEQNSQMSDRGREAMSKSFVQEDDKGNLEFGEGATDLDTWLLTMANVAGQFASTAVPGAGAAGLAAKAANLGSKGKVIANATAMGVTGGSAATGQGMEQARQEVNNMPNEVLVQSPLFADVLRGIHANKPELSAVKKWDAAKTALSNKVAQEVRTDPKVLLANFGASAIGDPIIGKALTGARLAKSGALRSALAGFVTEGTTEAVQAGVQQYGINQALQPIDNRDEMKDVVSAGLNEGLAGGGFGAAAGTVGGIANRQQPEAAQVTPDPITEPEYTPDPTTEKVKETNSTLGEAMESMDKHSANMKKTVENFDIPAVARNAGVNNDVEVGRFGDQFTSPSQEALKTMRNQTIADMVSEASNYIGPTPQDRELITGDVLPPEQNTELSTRQNNLSVGGDFIEGEAAQINGLLGQPDQPFSVPIDHTLASPTRQIEDKNIIFGDDNRPAQQQAEKAQTLEKQQTEFKAQANKQNLLPQKDIIFAGNETGVNVAANGKPFKSEKEAKSSKLARKAKRQGLNVEVVPFGNGFGWQAVNDNAQQEAVVTEQPEVNNITEQEEKLPLQPEQSELENNQVNTTDDIKGEMIDQEWQSFTDESGTKKIPRSDMPQIKAENRGAMVNFMNARDIKHEADEVKADTLKPTQQEFSPEKVKKAMSFEGGNRSILVSQDGYVLDGHHQWLAAREKGETVNVIRLDAPIETLVPLAKEMPSTETQDNNSTETPDPKVEIKETELEPTKVKENKKPVEQTENILPQENIDDFGEKLGGARKDAWGGFAESLDDNTSIKTEPLSKSLPQPDYEKMAAEGVEPEHLAFIAIARDSIKSKPRSSYKLGAWVRHVENVKNQIKQVLNGEIDTRKAFSALSLSSSYGSLNGAKDAIKVIATAHPSKLKDVAGYRITSGSYSVYQGVEHNPSKVMFNIEKKGTRFNFDTATETLAEAQENLAKLIDIENESTTKKGKHSKISTYQNRLTKEIYLGWKGASGILKIKTFKTTGEARNYLENNRDEIETTLQKMKDTPNMRKPINAERSGPERIADNVTPAIFGEAFGFRGVEFGNWVEQGKRQKDLNQAYDSLMDLSEALDIPPEALSLNGQLGLAFGARGKGGKNPAAAHYEPGTVVINLTKKAGSGSLAHEWWHALDNYFGKQRNKTDFITDSPYSLPTEDIRPEMAQAFKAVRDAINVSDLPERSSKLDERRSKAYWATTVEMTARSFESFIIDKLGKSDISNDYLANVVSDEAWEAAEALGFEEDSTYPYPKKAEQEKINNAYQTLFDTIEHKKTDQGTMLFSKSKPKNNAKGINFKKAQKITDEFIESINGANGLNFKILQSNSEAEKLWRMSLAGAVVKGAYEEAKKTVYIIADNIDNVKDLKQTLAHEAIAHGGLDTLFTKEQSKAFVNRIRQTKGRKAFSQYWIDADKDYAGESLNIKAEEIFARFVEHEPTQGELKYWWNAFKRWIANQFSKLGVNLKEDTEIAAMREMMQAIVIGFKVNKTDINNKSNNDLKFSRSNSFKNWFGNSQVVDENGEPAILYHGTNQDFSEFSTDTIFLTPNKDTANIYSRDHEMDGGNVMPVYVSAKKIFDTRKYKDRKIFQDSFYRKYGNGGELSDNNLPDWTDAEDFKEFFADNDLDYDGVYIQEPQGDYSIAVFEPNQIKSATGNNGNFNPDNDNILFSKKADTRTAKEKLGLEDSVEETIVEHAKEKAKETIDTLKSDSFWKRLNEGVFDGLSGIKQAEDNVGITDPNKQGYVSARLASGLADVLHGVFHFGAPKWKDGIIQRKEDTKGLLEVFGGLGDDLNNWLAWMGAQRAEKLAEEGKENNLTQEDIDELKALANGKEAEFEAARLEYNKINSAILDVAQEAGLLSAEQRGAFDEEYYVPFFRDMGETDPEMDDIKRMIIEPHSRKGISGQSAQIKELKGGGQSTKDLLENIISRQSTLIDASLKNKAMMEVTDNLNGTDYMQAEKSEEISSLSQTDLNKLHRVKVMRNGKAEAYVVSDPSLLRALIHINDIGSKSLFNKVGRSAKRFLTAGITLSPDFIFKNFVRDAAHAWMVNKDGFKLGTDSIKGLKKAFKEDESYRDLIFSGAAFQGGYIHGADPEAAAQQIRRALLAKGLTKNEVNGYLDSLVTNGSQLIEKYKNISDKLENANRLSTYEAALAAGKSKRQSAFEAKDLMDYSLKGNFALIGTMIDMLPFFNARLQGISKLVRASKAGDGDKVLKVLSANLAMKGMKLAAFSLALAALNDEEEEYQELPDWDKDSNWHFFVDGDHFRIPKPFELGIIFGTMPERMFHFGTGTQNGDDVAKSITHAIFSTLALNPIPQAALPIVETMVNKSFFRDSAVEGMADENKQSEDRYSTYTSEAAKAIGKTFNWSPKKIDHLIKGYTGTIGGYVLGASDIVAHGIMGKQTAETPISRLPVIKAFYQGSSPKTNTKFANEFYEALSVTKEAYGSYKRAMELGDTSRQQELIESDGDKLRSRVALNRIQRATSKLGKQARAINDNNNLSSKQKRDKLEEIQRQKNSLYHQAYVTFNLGEW
jgi:hypothetical protein